jgi:hypothetical protein
MRINAYNYDEVHRYCHLDRRRILALDAQLPKLLGVCRRRSSSICVGTGDKSSQVPVGSRLRGYILFLQSLLVHRIFLSSHGGATNWDRRRLRNIVANAEEESQNDHCFYHRGQPKNRVAVIVGGSWESANFIGTLHPLLTRTRQ